MIQGIFLAVKNYEKKFIKSKKIKTTCVHMGIVLAIGDIVLV